MQPKDVIKQWIAAFNAADVNRLMDLYSDDVINHQVAYQPLEGKKAVRAMFEMEFGRAKMVCVPENIFQDGEWAILEWKDPLGLRGCGFFQIHNGKIIFQRGYFDKLSFYRVQGFTAEEAIEQEREAFKK